MTASRVTLLLAPLLLLGTSRPLASKDLTGEAVEVPAQLEVPTAPTARFGENTNNQGCFSTQVLDLVATIPVRNDGATTVTLDEAEATLLVDGARAERLPLRYSVGGETHEREPERYPIEPGETVEVQVASFAFLPGSALETVDQIDVILPVGDDALHVRFSDVRAVASSRR